MPLYTPDLGLSLFRFLLGLAATEDHHRDDDEDDVTSSQR